MLVFLSSDIFGYICIRNFSPKTLSSDHFTKKLFPYPAGSASPVPINTTFSNTKVVLIGTGTVVSYSFNKNK